MNYEKTLEYIYDLKRFGIKLGLKNIEFLLDQMGNPHKDLKVVHVAGTNGKGSVCAFTTSSLMEAGHKVGTFTSPHLVDFRERITVNNKMISKKNVLRLVEEILDASKKMEEKGLQNATFFEVLTAMGFTYFSDEKVDYAVVEVGMGGRLDATNVVTPLVSVITNVALDHQKHLGNCVRMIAREKAGIVKGAPLVTACNGISLDILRKFCKEKKSKLFVVSKDIFFEKLESNLSYQKFKVKTSKKCYKLKIHLLGNHQIVNAATSIGALEILGIGKSFVEKGLEKTKWPGRFEIIQKNPLIILDGAHNPDGAKKLRETLEEFVKKRIILVIGIASDKDVSEILSELLPLADFVVLTKAKYKGTSLEVLEEEVKNYNKNYKIFERVEDAFFFAKSIAKKCDAVCVAGSLYVVGEVKEAISCKSR
ncbi:MAG: bifunctional folylpolyglutamate synthase/dihydrofolate synthase [Candidatus Methanofastidiosia archaeon]